MKESEAYALKASPPEMTLMTGSLLMDPKGNMMGGTLQNTQSYNVNRINDRQTDRLTDRQTDRQTDKPTDRQADRPTTRGWVSGLLSVKSKWMICRPRKSSLSCENRETATVYSYPTDVIDFRGILVLA